VLSREEIEKRIKRRLDTQDHTLSRWDTFKPERYPIVFYGLGSDARGLAIYNLLLGNKGVALEWFTKAATFFRDSLSSYRVVSGSWESEAGSCNDFWLFSEFRMILPIWRSIFFVSLGCECTKGSKDTVFHHRGTVARSFTETFI
jgi:hypothetical protein